MIIRAQALPSRSFFLLGPRGTGKTTWLRQVLPDAHRIDLLLDRELHRYLRDPALFSQEVAALPRGAWVVIDEVQRLPALLNDVQDVISRRGSAIRFALTGSSARKLRREESNLLAARVINRRMFPLTAAELGSAYDPVAALRFGGLPDVVTAGTDVERVDLLEAYAANYLTQEVRHEALVKSLESFSRFLEVAALANAQVCNVSAIARDAAVARPTVQGYFEILVDTLLGTWVPAWRPRARIKEVGHAKFYLFDPGAVRALQGRLREPVGDEERGHLLETLVLGELRAHLSYASVGGELSYWRTPSGTEVDFVWSRGPRAVGIEVKAAGRWRRGDGDALSALVAEKRIQRGYGVYLGRDELRDGPVPVLPVVRFLEELAAGRVLPG